MMACYRNGQARKRAGKRAGRQAGKQVSKQAGELASKQAGKCSDVQAGRKASSQASKRESACKHAGNFPYNSTYNFNCLCDPLLTVKGCYAAAPAGASSTINGTRA